MNTASPHNRYICQRLDALGLQSENPRLVEGWLRVAHPTLDALSAEELDEEILLAACAIREAGQDESDRLAVSFGL